ncbi:hypothetical protein BGZ81_011790 [Podila clonocystis]|nr:hypothetical protein BGZ81_011790 [Podila clonocystis]
MAGTPEAPPPFPSPTAADLSFEVADPLPSTTTTMTSASSPMPATEHTSSAAPTETPSTPSTAYHSASEGNSGSSSSITHSEGASTAAPAVSFEQSISSPAPTRPRRPSTPGTQLTHSSHYSGESDLEEDDTCRTKGYYDDEHTAKEKENGGISRLNSLKTRPGRYIRNKVLSSNPSSITSSPPESNLETASDGKDKSAEMTRLPSGKSSRQDRHWPPGSWQVLDRKFSSEPPPSPGRLRRYFGRSVNAECVDGIPSPRSPSQSGPESGSGMSFTVSSLPAFKSMLSSLSGSPVLSSLPVPRRMQLSDPLSHVPESQPSFPIARARIQDTASSSSLASGSRLANMNVGLSDGNASLDKLNSRFKSPSVERSRIPRLVSHSSQVRPQMAGMQSPTDFMQSPCTAALYGKISFSSAMGSLLRPRSRSLSPSVRVQAPVASASPLADQPKAKKKKLNTDTEED